ncbi:hypothetical protein K7X08_014741 [Anisodus acutangulus]|uniref:non-specific serine/threonine protein kinase n=1 Tax=Anisodus acutangulus TaxID=402998 RepID=A0A9Q1LIT7_9SOLA|nr:hypothetical protein K7X08_014741 [Anisodus acutangulus]
MFADFEASQQCLNIESFIGGLSVHEDQLNSVSGVCSTKSTVHRVRDRKSLELLFASDTPQKALSGDGALYSAIVLYIKPTLKPVADIYLSRVQNKGADLSFSYTVLWKRWKSHKQATDPKLQAVTSKKKKSRKSGLSKSNTRNEKNKKNSHNDDTEIGKLLVSNTEIAKGSNGTIVLEGIYDGRPVAVKRLVQTHHEVALKEIQYLIASDQHPNIVRWYGVQYDQDFVYLALERCTCSLYELISSVSNSFQKQFSGNDQDASCLSDCAVKFQWKSGDKEDFPLWISFSSLVKIDEFGSGSSGWQAPEQLRHERQARAVDLFSLGCVLFFCITGGKHPYGDSLERDVNIVNNQKDLFLIENIPEAADLISALLHPKPELSLYYCTFTDGDMLCCYPICQSDRVELKDREDGSKLLEALESVKTVALGGLWNEKMDTAFINDISRYRRYKYDSVRDLLRVIRNKLNHYRELSKEIQGILGQVPEGFESYFSTKFPRLVIEVYKVFHTYCLEEDIFQKYFRGNHI